MASQYTRPCKDIGMHTIDRPIQESCLHASPYCRPNCFNVKLYKLYPAMHAKDLRNEANWQAMTGQGVSAELDRKRSLSVDRIRLMARGEALSTIEDIDRIEDICRANPERMVWMPTRAWRDPMLRLYAETALAGIPNLAMLASIDPSTTEQEYRDLVSSGWSTMFFGDADKVDGCNWGGPAEGFDCPKTFRGLKGHCAVCKAGCFAQLLLGRRVDVILKEH